MILVLLGCATTEYDRADLQIFVAAPLPPDAEKLHICVGGFGRSSLSSKAGAY